MIYLATLIIILKVLGLAFIITRFEPIQWVFEVLNKRFSKNIIFQMVYLLLSCLKCASFWIGLMMGGIWVAIFCFIVAFIYDKKFSGWENKIKF